MASAQDAKRVLILHDFWEQDAWGLEFDQAFLANLKNSLGRQTQISAQYLGLQQIQSEQALQRVQQHVAGMIQDQNVNLVVTVLPEAGDFYLEMESRFDVPVIFLLPGFESLPEGISSNPLVVVSAVWEKTISNTIEDMLALLPNTQTIEVFIGDNELDRIYGERVKQVAMNFADRVNFSYQQGLGPERLRSYAQQLDEDSLILILAYSSYRADQQIGELSFLPDLVELSPVPLFGFSPLNLASVVGGNITSTESYGVTAAAVADSLLRGSTDYLNVSEVGTQSFYDWVQLERWNLSPELLENPYVLLYEPNSLWQEYPIVIITVLNLILLLCAVLAFLTISLRRSKLAHAKIAASEKLVRESEAQYRLLASNSKDVIWTWDIATNRLNYCSPSVQSLLGYTPEEFMALPLNKAMTGKSVKQTEDAINSGNFDILELEIEYLAKDGSVVCCEIVAQVLPSASGELVEWVGVSRDIRQRKADEFERQQLEQQVWQTQRIESIGTLAGGIAHDFNNILSVVTGITELLKMELSNQGRASELLNNLMAASEKAKSLVGQILTFSRHSSGEKVVTNLPRLVQESLDILRAGFPKNQEIKMEVATDSLRIMADPTHVEQVIINLITNAAEASEDSHKAITLTINSCHFKQEKEFPYGRVSEGDYAVLIVKDRGKGIEPIHLDKIFEPFYTSKELGNGLGMAIVHGIVMSHDGAIDIQSSPGRGTTVSIYFPLTDEEDAPVIESPNVKETEQAKLRIMLIDDQEDLLNVLSLMLEQLSHECVAYSDPREALQAIEREGQDFDLIITDYSMPNISGLDIIDYCAKHSISAPIILSTGYSGPLAEGQPRAIQDFKLLHKPFKFSELQAVLQEAL